MVLTYLPPLVWSHEQSGKPNSVKLRLYEINIVEVKYKYYPKKYLCAARRQFYLTDRRVFHRPVLIFVELFGFKAVPNVCLFFYLHSTKNIIFAIITFAEL